MANPIRIAVQGKGFLPMLARGRVIASRYGLSPGKMDNALTTLKGVLTRYACSATLPVTASALALNPALAQKYSGQGLELAIHGLRHIDYSMLSLDEQHNHLGQALYIFQKLELPVKGFRCPYLRWNIATLAALSQSGFAYDSSQALALDVVGEMQTDAYRRALDFYRAQAAQEYLALPGWSDSLMRIPYCLPDDEALVDRLQITDPAVMAEIWLAMLDSTYQSGELLTLGLHPERVHLCQEALCMVLEEARSRSPGVWVARLDEIAAWYLALGEAGFEYCQEGDDLYRVKITAPAGATILARALQSAAATQPWGQGYQSVASNEFIFQNAKLPWIGLSPSTAASLERFLRHQGYLTERSNHPSAYTIYFERRSFSPREERPLLANLERENTPLVRLARWPEGAKSALAITGDVDAFTIWDYGRRIFNR